MGIHAFSDDGVGVATADMMKAAMQKCREVDGIIVAHTEDMSYRKPNACMHEGIRSKQLGLTGIPSACEYAQFRTGFGTCQGNRLPLSCMPYECAGKCGIPAQGKEGRTGCQW